MKHEGKAEVGKSGGKDLEHALGDIRHALEDFEHAMQDLHHLRQDLHRFVEKAAEKGATISLDELRDYVAARVR